MTPFRRPLLLATAAVLFSAVTGCATTPAPATIADTAARTPQLSTLTKLLADAGLTDTLRGTGPFTVFAPSDDAFKAVPAKTMAELAANKELLKAVLAYHVLATKVSSTDVKNGNVKTVQGADLAVGNAGTIVNVDEAVVTQADVAATNGVIHVIDKVLMPPKR